MENKAHENTKVVKSFYDAVSRRDWGSARSALELDVEWIEPYLPGLWFSGTHRGAEAVVREVLEPTGEKVEKFHIKIRKYFAVGDHVIAVGSFRGRGKDTGADLDAPTAHVWKLRDGKAVRVEAFHDSASWQAALGWKQSEAERMAA